MLPLYLLYQLQVSALQLGVVDGLYQGASGLNFQLKSWNLAVEAYPEAEEEEETTTTTPSSSSPTK